jgi:HPt (histidine-containing phosphotransfer) domain-containing protein
MTRHAALRAALEERWPCVRTRVVARIAVVGAFARDATGPVTRAEACAAAHQLHGGLGAFGHHEASTLAGQIERLLVTPSPAAVEHGHLAELVEQLNALVDRPP